MITYLQHDEIDKSRWDACIDRSANGLIYAYSWYLDIVSPRWDALVEGDYEKVMPLPWRKKWGIHYLFQPVLTQQLGVFSPNPIAEQEVARFLEFIPRKFWLRHIQLNTANPVDDQTGWKVEKRITHHLRLSPSYDDLRERYSENRFRDLKKATVPETKIESIGERALHHELRNQHEGTIRFSAAEWMTVLRLMEATTIRQRGFGLVARWNDRIIAGAYYYLGGSRIIYAIGHSTPKGRVTGSSTMLFDHAIRQYAGKNMTLDFEGSMIPGIARFFKSFGAIEVPYWSVTMNRLPWPLKLFKG